MIYRIVVKVRFAVQVIVLNLSFRVRRSTRTPESPWVVGPYEIAGMVFRIAESMPGARSVVLARHPYFDFQYGWAPSRRTYPGASVLRSWLLGPWKLGELARSSAGILYVSAEGFINAAHDYRQYEFRFLRKHGIGVACFFTGNDIRSPALMKELEISTGRPNLGTYLRDVNAVFGSPGYDDAKRKVAKSANDHASAVFNADLDQRSYLREGSHPFRYFHPDEEIVGDLDKFDDWSLPLVVHAPSAPILKGTPLVRAAVAQLRAEGHAFDYLELIGVPHNTVMEALTRAHIVLNEFYSYVPGVFAIEAMASGCAVITSADEHLDPQLPAGSNEAWMPTEHHEIAANLRTLLSDRDRARALAASGREWVLANATSSVSGAVVASVLASTTGSD